MYFGYYDLDYFLILIPIFALSWYVQYMLKSKFKKFSKQTLSANLSGKEIAEKMLSDHGIYDVKVISVKGQLSDHYNPQKKTVNLSQSVLMKEILQQLQLLLMNVGMLFNMQKDMSG
jgi:Zn-dependent membrane protease YugP